VYNVDLVVRTLIAYLGKTGRSCRERGCHRRHFYKDRRVEQHVSIWSRNIEKYDAKWLNSDDQLTAANKTVKQ
jgi:hypothetical protein